MEPRVVAGKGGKDGADSYSQEEGPKPERIEDWGFWTPLRLASRRLVDSPFMILGLPFLALLVAPAFQAVAGPAGGLGVLMLTVAGTSAATRYARDLVLDPGGCRRGAAIDWGFRRIFRVILQTTGMVLLLAALLMAFCTTNSLLQVLVYRVCRLFGWGALSFHPYGRWVPFVLGSTLGLLLLWVVLRAMYALQFSVLAVQTEDLGPLAAVQKGWRVAGQGPFGTVVLQTVATGIANLLVRNLFLPAVPTLSVATFRASELVGVNLLPVYAAGAGLVTIATLAWVWLVLLHRYLYLAHHAEA